MSALSPACDSLAPARLVLGEFNSRRGQSIGVADSPSPRPSPLGRGRMVGRWFGWRLGLEYRTVVGPKRQRTARTPGRFARFKCGSAMGRWCAIVRLPAASRRYSRFPIGATGAGLDDLSPSSKAVTCHQKQWPRLFEATSNWRLAGWSTRWQAGSAIAALAGVRGLYPMAGRGRGD